jgi:cation diffusion facilitator CzcD-associated flavoprotein CzcO
MHFDVLIVGAGISGICGAWHLMDKCPGKSFVILDNKESHGGTWLQHTYPGIRSDSDLYTFGFEFKPWDGVPIASADEILKYLRETIDENLMAPHIRYGHEVKKARWSSADKHWQVEVLQLDTGETLHFTCTFLWMGAGYYRHAEGYMPNFPGHDDFTGRLVHPQTWPDDLDYRNKKVVVIGSGATAATLIPAMADEAAHVTMLQRSPTYFVTAPNRDDWAEEFRRLEVPREWAYDILRRKYLRQDADFTNAALNDPARAREELIGGLAAQLPENFDVGTHFSPTYDPWRQRIALLPDSDLLKCIARGEASVVTDHISHFDATGIQLKSGEHLEADIIISATGFNLNVLGDIGLEIDGNPLDVADSVAYRGALISGVPNMAFVFGYLRYSWTLRADVVSKFVCRVLNKMDEAATSVVTPTLRPQDRDMAIHPFIRPEEFDPGYLQRGRHLMPRQGDQTPWVYDQDYIQERAAFEACDLDDDGALVYR